MLRNRTFFIVWIAVCGWLMYTTSNAIISSLDTENTLGNVALVPSLASLPTTDCVLPVETGVNDKLAVPMAKRSKRMTRIRSSYSGSSFAASVSATPVRSLRTHSYGTGAPMTVGGGRSARTGVSGAIAQNLTLPAVKGGMNASVSHNPVRPMSAAPRAAAGVKVAGLQSTAPRQTLRSTLQPQATATYAEKGLSLGYASAAGYITPAVRRNGEVKDGSWENLLHEWFGESAFLNETQVKEMWEKKVTDTETNMPDGGTVEELWTYITSGRSQNFHVPVGDGLPLLLLLASVYLIIKQKRNKTIKSL